jgi:hypothetical protein
VVRGQRRLDRLEALDTIRLAPGAAPLTATELGEFMRNAQLATPWRGFISGHGNALQFYEQRSVMHFVFKLGCSSNTWQGREIIASQH